MPKKKIANSTYRHSGKRSAARISQRKSVKNSGQASDRKFSSRARMTNSTKRFLIVIRNDIQKISLKTKLLLGIGLLFLLIPAFFYVNEGIQLAYVTPKVIPIKSVYAVPTRILIASVHIDLPIVETTISQGVWQIADNAISHLTISARPGEKGAIILYGHNTNDRFGPIRWVSIGQKIIVSTADGKVHLYKVIARKDVSPQDVAEFVLPKTETLILYTCDGFADLQRFLLIAKPEN